MGQYEKDKKTVINLRASDELKSMLLDLAMLEGEKMSAIVQKLIKKEHKKRITKINGLKNVKLDI